MHLEPGQQIERFVVEGILGTGGAASVYRVRHVALGSTFALKVLAVPSKSIRGRMLQEGRIQATIRASNVVQVVDVFDVEGHLGLLMEYVKGPSLAQFLASNTLPLDEALAVFGGILAGVDVAHDKGLIHRDIKPANVLLQLADDGMWPKVTDFGIAKGGESADPVDVTRPGSTMGTPCYMPPEQIHDASSVDKRADIWSLGCVLYELVCHQRAFPGDYMLDILNAVVRGEFKRPEELVPDLPKNVLDAIYGSLVLDPDQRFPDCRTFAAVLGNMPDAESVGEALERHLPRSSPSIRAVRSLAFQTPEPVPLRDVVPPAMVSGNGPGSSKHVEVPTSAADTMGFGAPAGLISNNSDSGSDPYAVTDEVERPRAPSTPSATGLDHVHGGRPTFLGLPLFVPAAGAVLLAVLGGFGIRSARVAGGPIPARGVSVDVASHVGDPEGERDGEPSTSTAQGTQALPSTSGPKQATTTPTAGSPATSTAPSHSARPSTAVPPEDLLDDVPRRAWTRVKFTGDAKRVTLRAPGREFLLPTKVQPGSYDVEAWFSETEVTPAGRVVVPVATTLRLDCSVIWQRCEVKE